MVLLSGLSASNPAMGGNILVEIGRGDCRDAGDDRAGKSDHRGDAGRRCAGRRLHQPAVSGAGICLRDDGVSRVQALPGAEI